MKTVVLNDTGREVEFKPDFEFEKYLDLTAEDIKKRFGSSKKFKPSKCPACRSPDNIKAFIKFGFQYVECKNCGTVYMLHRPQDVDIRDHFLNSPSFRFWRNTLSKTTGKTRREKIYFPRLQWIIDIAEEYLTGPKIIADFSSKNMDYINELLKNDYFEEKYIINPYFDIKDISAKKNQKSDVISELNKARKYNSVNIAVAFEAFDYTSDVDTLLKTMKGMLIRNGLCFITVVSISGFDLQVLWDNSKSIFPLDRINVFSLKGLNILFKRHGFEILEYSTPGVLDFDIVEHMALRNPDLKIPRFIKNMIERGDEQLIRDFQTFLQANRLSSFVRIVAEKN